MNHAMSLAHGSTALLLLDLQRDFLEPDGVYARHGLPVERLRGIVPAIRRVVEGSRAVHVPVFALRFTIYTSPGGVPLGLDPHRWVDVATVGVMAGLGPYGFHVARKARRTRRLEERFPDFLRDLASSRRHHGEGILAGVEPAKSVFKIGSDPAHGVPHDHQDPDSPRALH